MEKEINEFDGGFTEKFTGTPKEIRDLLTNRFGGVPYIDELLDYANKLSFEDKVRRVHRLCVRASKIALADKIEAKYRQYLPQDDMLMSLRWALMVQKQFEDNGKKSK